MKYTKKAKCSGCFALQINPDSIACKLNFAITTTEVSGKVSNPKPDESCYKPTTELDYYKSIRLNNNRVARIEAKK
jgi:hypothetical protein